MGGNCCKTYSPEDSPQNTHEAQMEGKLHVRPESLKDDNTLSKTTDSTYGPLSIVAELTSNNQIYYDNNLIKKSIEKYGEFKQRDTIIEIRPDAELIGPYKYHKDEAIYFGQYNGRIRSGYGECILTTGLYEGNWKDDKPNGIGRFMTIKGCVYDGEFVDGHYQGKGTYINLEGNRYEGDFKNGVKEGNGTETNEDGTWYTGDFSKNNKNGQGTFYWKDGSTYKGDFADNELHGTGVYKWADGRVYDGDWLNSNINGFGTFNWPDGRKYTGSFVKHKKEGYGEYTWPNGKTIKGQWQNNKLEGSVEVIDKIGNSSFSIFSNNRPMNSSVNSFTLNSVKFEH